jgi:hypothetical protein
MYQEAKTKTVNAIKSKNVDECSDRVTNYLLYSIYAFCGCYVIRLYFIIMALKWLFIGSAIDEKEDRYDLVLGFTGLTISTLVWAIAPLFVGIILDVNNSVWF